MTFPARTLDTVCDLLLGAFVGAPILRGNLTVADDVHDPSAVGNRAMPLLAFGDPSARMANWHGFAAQYQVTWPAVLYLRRTTAGSEERVARIAVDDLLAHALKIDGLPVLVDTGKVEPYSERVARLSIDEEKLRFFADRSGPRIASFQIATRTGSPYSTVALSFAMEFLAEYDPRTYYHARAVVIGMIPWNLTRSDDPAEWVPTTYPDARDLSGMGRHDTPHPLLDETLRTTVQVVDPVRASLEVAGADPDDQLKSIDVIPRSVTLAALATQQLIAIALYQSGAVLNETDAASWASSDATKATVSSGGLVTAVATGTANITATWLGVVSSACAVTVS